MKSVAAAALFATLANAHGGVVSYAMGGKAYPGWSPYNSASGQVTIERPYPSFNPLLKADLGSVNIRCNNGGSTGTGVSGTVAAGAKVTAYWSQWTHAEGPVMVYMAKCPSGGCNSWDGAGKVWFKIDEAGLLSGTVNKGVWGNTLVMDKLNWESTIPASLAPGEYLIRHELLALHQGNTPQFYPECAQIIVTGSGTAQPSGDYLVSFPGVYSPTDPSIDFSVYSPAAFTATTYKIPGPAVWNGSGSGSAPPPPPPAPVTTTARPATTMATATRAPVSSAPPPASSAAPPVTPPSSCSVAKYGQCGGIGFTGCKTCAAGSTCKANGDYYSQCV